jgi:hypothetical protein
MANMSKTYRENKALCLGVEGNAAAVELVGKLVAVANKLYALSVELCNGPDWQDGRNRQVAATPPELKQASVQQFSRDMEEWQTLTEAKQIEQERKARALFAKLLKVAPEMEGCTLELNGDPRGYVCRIAMPHAFSETHAHYANGTRCLFLGTGHCSGGERGELRAIGLEQA